MAERAPNSGQFQPGNSANPGGRRGRPETWNRFRDFLRTYTEEAAIELVDRALGRRNEAGVRDKETASERSLELLLAYQHGKPPQPVSGEGGEGAAIIQILTGVPRAGE